jgi:hypothetical protein
MFHVAVGVQGMLEGYVYFFLLLHLHKRSLATDINNVLFFSSPLLLCSRRYWLVTCLAPNPWLQISSYYRLNYDRQPAGQSVVLSNTYQGLKTNIYYCRIVGRLLAWDALSGVKTDMPFTTVACFRQHSHSRLMTIFTVSNSRLSKRGRTGPRIYYSPNIRWSSYTIGYLAPLSSPFTSRRATVEALNPASTRG